LQSRKQVGQDQCKCRNSSNTYKNNVTLKTQIVYEEQYEMYSIPPKPTKIMPPSTQPEIVYEEQYEMYSIPPTPTKIMSPSIH